MEDLAWLLNKLAGVAFNWLNFGLHLGIKFHVLKAIEKNYPRDSNDCLRETLVCWLKGRNPTTGQLLKALDTTGEKELSHTLKQSFIQCDHRQGYLYNTCAELT